MTVDDLKAEIWIWMNEAGKAFLSRVRREIRTAGNVETGRLVASFKKGGAENVWQVGEGSLALGSRVPYADNVNTGRLTASGWREGSHYYDAALEAFSEVFPKMVKDRMEEYLWKQYCRQRSK